MAQTHSSTGDNVGRDKIDRQTNLGNGGTYIEYQVVEGAKQIPRALTAPPFQSEVFLGREDDLKAIKNKLFSGDNMLLLVNGQGGVGKTTIAAKYYATYQDHYAHTAWVLSERSISNALITHLASPLGIAFDQNNTEAERFKMILEGMANLKKTCLLVIDNANEVEDLDKNYMALRRCNNFHLLLTSRITEFEQAQFYPIAGLPEDKSLELFEKYYKKPLNNTEKALFSNIYTAISGNTLVVEILAKNLYLLNRLKHTYSLADLLHDLQTKGLLALSKSQTVSVGYQAKETLRKEKPEDIIAAMYDLSELIRAETALLSVFAVLPAENIGFEWLESLLPNTDNLERNAFNLAQRGWIEFDQDTTSFKCNPVVQEITKKKNEILRGDCEGLINSLIEKLDRDTLHEENYKYSTVFVRYAETVVNAFEEPDYSLHVIYDRLGYFYQEVGNLDKALSIYEKDHDLIQKLIVIDPQDDDLKNSLATTLSWTGTIYATLGNLDKALQYYEDDAELTKQLYESYPTNVSYKNGLAISYEKLGETHASLGNLDKALQYYEERSALGKQLYESYPTNVSFKNGLAISYSKLGWFYHYKKPDLTKAQFYYEKCKKLFSELATAFPMYVEFKKNLVWVEGRLKEL